MRYSRADLRGKPLDEDCKKAKISRHEFGVNDKRKACYGLYGADMDIMQKCIKCGAHYTNLKPFQT